MMKTDRILVGCAVKENNAEYANLETEYLFKTLRQYGGNLANSKKIACFTEKPDSSIQKILNNLQVDIRINKIVDERQAFANKIRILDEGIKEDVDVIVMLDTDVIVSRDFSEFLNTQKIMIKPEDRDPFTLEEWKQLFDLFELPFPQDRFYTSCTHEETIPYFNGGVIIIPKIYASKLLEMWEYFLKKLLDEKKNLPGSFSGGTMSASKSNDDGLPRFFDQIAFTLALIKAKLPYEALPLSMNYPYSGTVHPDEHPDELIPYIIHHHHCIGENSKLLSTPYPNINKRIAEINSFLIKNKEYDKPLAKDDPLVIRNLTIKHSFWEIIERIKDLPLQSKNADLQYYLALALHHTAGIAAKDEALPRYNIALENGFDKFMVYKDRGNLHFMASNIANAKKDLMAALEINPFDTETIRRLALTDDRVIELTKLHSEQKYQGIVEKLSNLSIDDKNPYLQYYLAVSLHKTNQRLDEALTRYNVALENGLQDFWLLLNRAQLNVILKNYEDFSSDFSLGYDLLLSYFESTEPHLDTLRNLLWKQEEDLAHLRKLNVKKDEDIIHLRKIIQDIHDSSSWKLLTKLDFLKKNKLDETNEN